MSHMSHRDIAIDIVRTFAIITMIGANLASLLLSPHEVWFRAVCSSAAPLFITLAGMFATLSVIKAQKNARFLYFLKRGGFLMLTGAFIDVVVFRDMPFMSVDVLYCIGFGLPIAFLMAHLSTAKNILVASLIIIVTATLQHLLGYHLDIWIISLSEIHLFSLDEMIRVGRMWLIDGWFPIFPWVGYLVFGVILAKLRWSKRAPTSFATLPYVLTGGLLCLAGILWMACVPTTYSEREGFIELFYPPSTGFIIASFGFTILACSIADLSTNFAFLRPLMPLGEASLFVYVGHIMIIELIELTFKQLTTDQYIICYLCITLSLWLCTLFLRAVKKRHPKIPTAVKWLIGS